MELETAHTIQRCPHDRQNPYVMINQALIRDPSISPECAYLLIYLLSLPHDWQIRVNVLMTQMKDRMGRNKVQKLLREAREAGYMMLEKYHGDRGYIRCRYLLSETPKFKNNNRQPENQVLDSRPSDFQAPKEVLKDKKDLDTNISSLTPPEESAKASSKEATQLATLLLCKITEVDPDFRQRDLRPWITEIERMIRLDERSPEKIFAVIEWAFADKFWRSKVLSAAKLRKQFNQLHLLMTDGAVQTANNETRDFARSHIKSYSSTYRTAKFLPDGIQNTNTGEIVPYNIPLAEFSQRLPDAFMTANGYAR